MNFFTQKKLIKLFSDITLSLNSVRFLKTMKFDTPQFRSLFTPELTYLAEIFTKNNYELRMAGGAVRDLLLGAVPTDVDFATNATPTQMKELFEKEKIRMFHKKGEEHGTITCRINDKENFEITTLRIDVVCDGRRAEVKFTKDWKLDAFRRDLTVNSIFLGLDGTIYDYTGGVDDIKTRRITFVGDPAQRIQEDYLRILRYFRFFGRLANLESEHESQNIETFVKYRDGLKTISGERIWMELKKILVGRLSASVVRCMMERCGLGPQLSLPSNDNDNLKNALREFDLVAAANCSSPNSPLDIEPSTALSSLLLSKPEAVAFQKRCKCSNTEKNIVEFIVENRIAAKENSENEKFFKNLILDGIFFNGQDQIEFFRSKCLQLLKYINADKRIQQLIAKWSIDIFPVTGIDLMTANVERGPKMQSTLTYLHTLWKNTDLQATKEELLKHIKDPEIDEIIIPNKKKKE